MVSEREQEREFWRFRGRAAVSVTALSCKHTNPSWLIEQQRDLREDIRELGELPAEPRDDAFMSNTQSDTAEVAQWGHPGCCPGHSHRSLWPSLQMPGIGCSQRLLFMSLAAAAAAAATAGLQTVPDSGSHELLVQSPGHCVWLVKPRSLLCVLVAGEAEKNRASVRGFGRWVTLQT